MVIAVIGVTYNMNVGAVMSCRCACIRSYIFLCNYLSCELGLEMILRELITVTILVCVWGSVMNL